MDDDKKITFYNRLMEEYKKAPKPFTYEVDLTSAQPKPRAAKFNILINKFISIYKSGMKEMYDNQEDIRDNYWSQLLKKFLGKHRKTQISTVQPCLDNPHFELIFINEMYWEKPKNKMKKYFILLLHSKRIFQVLETILTDMEYLYEDPQQKRRDYERQIAYVDFLKDGQFRIMGQIITKYEEYAQEKEAQLKIRRQQQLQAARIRQEEDRIRRVKQQQERLQREAAEKKRQEEQEKRKRVQQELKQSKLKVEQSRDDPVITSEYFPEVYQAISREKPVDKKYLQKGLDIPTRKNEAYHGKSKRSDILFMEEYKDELEVFSYNLKPEMSQEKQNCAACKKPLKVGIYILGGNQNFCYYTGKWYCNDDISKNRMPIPWKAAQDFDLRGYTVCKTAFAQLESYYEKPLVEIPRDSELIQNNHKLYTFLLLKRQIHLIYDSICNVDHIKGILGKKMNYCLKQNLFSMKNLYDIYNGQETTILERDYQILSRHFYRCEICQKKRGYICPQCKDPIKIFPFELKETHGCKVCKKLYHRKCLVTGKCQCTD